MLIQLNDIKKYFTVRKGLFYTAKEYIRAVDQVSLDIEEGVNLGLVGESGSGKTTLGRVLMKLYPLDGGQIIFEGQDITRLPSKETRLLRKQFQMVFQDPYSSLDPRYTIRNVLKEALILEKQFKTYSQQEEKMKKVLSAVGLPSDTLGRFPHEFSGGERQRIAIARALMMNPKLLILDEAVSSLDVLVQQQIIDLLKDLQKSFNVTYLFITHNLRVVRKLCHKIAVMYKGKIVELAPTEEIFQNPMHPYTRGLLSAAIAYKAQEINWEKQSIQGFPFIRYGKWAFCDKLI